MTGIKADLSGPQQVPEILEKATSSASDTGTGSESSSEDGDSNEDAPKKQFVNSARPREESPNSKKVIHFSINHMNY